MVGPINCESLQPHRLATMRIRMKVISEHDVARGAVVNEGTHADPVAIHGSGPHAFVCGACGVVLVDGVRFGQVESVAFRCAACGAFNAIPRVMGGDGTFGS